MKSTNIRDIEFGDSLLPDSPNAIPKFIFPEIKSEFKMTRTNSTQLPSQEYPKVAAVRAQKKYFSTPKEYALALFKAKKESGAMQAKRDKNPKNTSREEFARTRPRMKGRFL